MATMGAIAHADPQRIKDRISYNPQTGEFDVTLWDGKQWRHVPVTQADIDANIAAKGGSGVDNYPDGGQAAVARGARVGLRQDARQGSEGHRTWPGAHAMEALTGNDGKWVIPATEWFTTQHIDTQITEALQSHQPVTVSTSLFTGDLAATHVYAVEGITGTGSDADGDAAQPVGRRQRTGRHPDAARRPHRHKSARRSWAGTYRDDQHRPDVTKERRGLRKALIAIVVVLLVAAVGVGGYLQIYRPSQREILTELDPADAPADASDGNAAGDTIGPAAGARPRALRNSATRRRSRDRTRLPHRGRADVREVPRVCWAVVRKLSGEYLRSEFGFSEEADAEAQVGDETVDYLIWRGGWLRRQFDDRLVLAVALDSLLKPDTGTMVFGYFVMRPA